MNLRARSWLVAALQSVLALSVIGKVAWDRVALPRVWARTVPVDPDDPFRGRYVRLWLDAEDRRRDSGVLVVFRVEDGRLVARDADGLDGVPIRQTVQGAGVISQQPVAYFISEHDPDPSRLPPGQELWAEVSVPTRGLPRPIRLEARPRP